MKVKVLFAALASLVLASCTNNEQLLDETKKGREIRFAVASQTPQTRAEHEASGDYNGLLKVWAWEKGKTTPIIAGDIYNSSNKTFSSGKFYYYPVNGNAVDFVLVPTETIGHCTFTEPNRTESKTTFSFELGHDSHDANDHNTDMMTSEVISAEQGDVAVILRHLTAKLNVHINQSQKSDDVLTAVVSVNKLSIKGIKNHGKVSVDEKWKAINDGKECFWDQVADDEPCEWSIITEGSYPLASHNIGVDNTPFFTTSSHYVLPQELEQDKQQLYLEYTIETKYKNGQPDVTEKFKKTINLSDITNLSDWAMNKNITYNISINPLETTNKITFDVKVEEWGNQNGNATILPSDSENM